MGAVRVFAGIAAACLIATGCTALPAAGPNRYDVLDQATMVAATRTPAGVGFPYALVDIGERLLPLVGDAGPGSLHATFGGGRGGAPEIRVGVGDVVEVTIFESAAGGLFIPTEAGSRDGNFVTLPRQTVDHTGFISVPYAGQVPAAGRTLPQIQLEIEARLANRAIEPQAVVALIERRATEVAVLGEVNAAGKFQVNAAGDRIVDMISKAGGLRHPGYESYVTLQRRGREATVFFNTLMTNAAENIYTAPGDTIYVYREQRAFIAFGAAGQNGRFVFDAERLSLADGIAKAGGLLDERADPSMVLMFRMEDRKVLEGIGADLARFPGSRRIPTVYRADLRQTATMFVLQKFPLRDKDVLYVTNADAVELMKFLDLVSAVSSTVRGVVDDADRTTVTGGRFKP